MVLNTILSTSQMSSMKYISPLAVLSFINRTNLLLSSAPLTKSTYIHSTTFKQSFSYYEFDISENDFQEHSE